MTSKIHDLAAERHARASARCAARSANTASVMSDLPRVAAISAKPAQCEPGMPRRRQQLTAESERASALATSPVPPSASMIESHVHESLAMSRSSDTLGGLVHWYTNGDVDRPVKEALKNPGKLDDGYPKWQRLAAATRKDYLESFEYLRPEFDIRLADITQPDLYDLRDKCANVKWPRFADQMIAALSSAFRQAVKRSNKTGMMINPCRDMDKAHQADPNANREWYPEEWKIVERAPMEIKIPLMLARYVGMRGQTIVVVSWRQYVDHDLTGKAFRFLPAKTDKTNTVTLIPAMTELQDFLTSP